MSKEKKCGCTNGPTLFLACSGAADVGEISDLTARSLARQGKGRMFCAAAIGAGIPDKMDVAESASRLLVIDGCACDCARILLEQKGFSEFTHIQLEDLGLKKGQSPATEENVSKATAHCIKSLG